MSILYRTNVQTEFNITSVNDLSEYKKYMEVVKLKPNFTEIGKALGKDPRTIKKHYNSNGQVEKTRSKKSSLDIHYDTLVLYLSDATPNRFYYKKCIGNFLSEFHNITIPESTLRSYFSRRPILNKLFKLQRRSIKNFGDVMIEIEQERDEVYNILGIEKITLENIKLPAKSDLLFTEDEYIVLNEKEFLPPINNIKNNDENVKLEKEEAFIRGTTRNEQAPGIQAQLDWKENQQFTLKSGKIIIINIGMLLMSHSRYKFIFFAIDKTQYSLFDFLTNVFIELNGAVDHIVTDNMKTIMDSARTRNSPGIMNEKAKKFAETFNFEFKPCIAYEPNSKGKVEAPMKLFDEIFAYNGLIDLEELVALIYKIGIRANHTVCQGTNYIPAHYLELEKRNIKNAIFQLFNYYKRSSNR
jgi:hypothetical protein